MLSLRFVLRGRRNLFYSSYVLAYKQFFRIPFPFSFSISFFYFSFSNLFYYFPYSFSKLFLFYFLQLINILQLFYFENSYLRRCRYTATTTARFFGNRKIIYVGTVFAGRSLGITHATFGSGLITRSRRKTPDVFKKNSKKISNKNLKNFFKKIFLKIKKMDQTASIPLLLLSLILYIDYSLNQFIFK